VQLLLRNKVLEVKKVQDVKDKKAGEIAGLFLLARLRNDSPPGD
jgi:hypothetical protein